MNPDPLRPLPGTQTGQVWDLADEITREKGRCADRSEVVDRFVAGGGNRNTASTTYYRWKQHHDAKPSTLVDSSDQRRDATPESTVAPPKDTTADLPGTEENRLPPSDDDLEPDSGVEDEREDPRLPVEHPFDPSKIRVRTVQVLVDQLVARISHCERGPRSRVCRCSPKPTAITSWTVCGSPSSTV